MCKIAVFVLLMIVSSVGLTIEGGCDPVSGESRPVPQFVRDVFNKLYVTAEVKAPLELKVVDAPYPNAGMCVNGVLFVTPDLIVMGKYNINFLAGVIGHEIGHWQLKHWGTDAATMADLRKFEMDADMYSFHLMKKAGYNQCDYAKYFELLAEVYGNAVNPTHPKYEERIKALSCTNNSK